MKSLLSVVVVLAVFYTRRAVSYPNGAPQSACDNLLPRQNSQGLGHQASAQSIAVPYMIDLTPFNNSGTWEYTPGSTYTLTLSGVSNEEFRGFFVQARTVVLDDRVGTFGVAESSNSRLSSCATATDGITHTNNENKTSISFRWTAPLRGAGPVRFRFSVVEVRDIFWANQRTPRMITEADSAAIRLTSAGFWTILMVALALVLKAAI